MISNIDKLEEYFDSKKLKYTKVSEKVFKVNFNADNLSTIHLYLAVNKSGSYVNICCNDIASFSGKEKIGYELANHINSHYNWGRAYIDDDGDFTLDFDVNIDFPNGAEYCYDTMYTIVHVIDAIYPTIMKRLWA